LALKRFNRSRVNYTAIPIIATTSDRTRLIDNPKTFLGKNPAELDLDQAFSR
jgi:hypothetical protein